MGDYGEMATPINRLKEMGNTDTDIDYDMILQNLHNSDIGGNDMRPKKAMNANNFVKSLETDKENSNLNIFILAQ